MFRFVTSCLPQSIQLPVLRIPGSLAANAAAKVASSCPLAFPDPPSYDELPPTTVSSALPEPAAKSTWHPRIAVLLGVSTSWHVPLLVARALSTAPAMWWGLRCAFTFLGDLLLSDGMGNPADPWTGEKRFRVTEVFLAILWVCQRSPLRPPLLLLRGVWLNYGQCSASAYLSYFFTDCLMSRWYDPLS